MIFKFQYDWNCHWWYLFTPILFCLYCFLSSALRICCTLIINRFNQFFFFNFDGHNILEIPLVLFIHFYRPIPLFVFFLFLVSLFRCSFYFIVLWLLMSINHIKSSTERFIEQEEIALPFVVSFYLFCFVNSFFETFFLFLLPISRVGFCIKNIFSNILCSFLFLLIYLKCYFIPSAVIALRIIFSLKVTMFSCGLSCQNFKSMMLYFWFLCFLFVFFT